MSDIGSQPRPFSLAKFDGRTRQGKFLRDVRNDLTELAERIGLVTSPRRIEAAAQLWLCVEEFEEKRALGTLTEDGERTCALCHVALAVHLHDLGACAALERQA